ncbi:hypothetical protein P171DRAFT_65779 [Karstenula rhodostoma CBS 690.94]|uniref:Uncharacterized protein n=1 Tax=Karstenula rhodostoma CBS 690.94 TaxID=1392251 RepID=A0A9P4PG83_9PLEO|nr:hypothetical protein P171DRAFT_65779 [Karstenula rhodostoma CBS 690.94]
MNCSVCRYRDTALLCTRPSVHTSSLPLSESCGVSYAHPQSGSGFCIDADEPHSHLSPRFSNSTAPPLHRSTAPHRIPILPRSHCERLVLHTPRLALTRRTGPFPTIPAFCTANRAYASRLLPKQHRNSASLTHHTAFLIGWRGRPPAAHQNAYCPLLYHHRSSATEPCIRHLRCSGVPCPSFATLFPIVSFRSLE